MITELTPKQEERLLENTIQYWLEIGRSYKRLDKSEVSTIIGKLYEEAGERKPEVQFFASPQACVNEIQSENRFKYQLINRLEDRLWSRLGNRLGTQLGNRLWNQLGNQLGNQLRSQLGNLLSDELQVKIFYANLWYMYPWLAFYDLTCRIGVRYTDEQNYLLGLWLRLIKECFWWFLCENTVFVPERPTNLELDERGRLHSIDDIAMKFEDDSGIYAVHGVRVDEKVIRREYTISDIENESNVEVRRVMMDLYGQSRYLQESNAETVHEDDCGVLYRKPINNDEDLMMVKVVNSTPEPDGSFKDYFIRVEPSNYGGLKTARAAVASTWRNKDGSLAFEKPEDYFPVFET